MVPATSNTLWGVCKPPHSYKKFHTISGDEDEGIYSWFSSIALYEASQIGNPLNISNVASIIKVAIKEEAIEEIK